MQPNWNVAPPNLNVHETLWPYYAVGGKAITAKYLHDHQLNDLELDKILKSQETHRRKLKNFPNP